MIKAEGHWAGYIMYPENPTNQIDFYEMSGLIESVDSVFWYILSITHYMSL